MRKKKPLKTLLAESCSDRIIPFKFPFECVQSKSRVDRALFSPEDMADKFKSIKHKLPANYINKPNTVILIDTNDNPVLVDNGDGTVSGIPIEGNFALAE